MKITRKSSVKTKKSEADGTITLENLMDNNNSSNSTTPEEPRKNRGRRSMVTFESPKVLVNCESDLNIHDKSSSLVNSVSRRKSRRLSNLLGVVNEELHRMNGTMPIDNEQTCVKNENETKLNTKRSSKRKSSDVVEQKNTDEVDKYKSDGVKRRKSSGAVLMATLVDQSILDYEIKRQGDKNRRNTSSEYNMSELGGTGNDRLKKSCSEEISSDATTEEVKKPRRRQSMSVKPTTNDQQVTGMLCIRALEVIVNMLVYEKQMIICLCKDQSGICEQFYI